MGTLLSALTPDYAAAEQVSFNDSEITATFETFPSPKGNGGGIYHSAFPKRRIENLGGRKSTDAKEAVALNGVSPR